MSGVNGRHDVHPFLQFQNYVHSLRSLDLDISPFDIITYLSVCVFLRINSLASYPFSIHLFYHYCL